MRDGPPKGARLDIAAIEAALLDRVTAASSAAGGLSDAVFTADIARRMVEGYRQLDQFLAEGRNPLGFGQSPLLLELNHVVLCGRSADRRTEHAEHIAATEARFYGDPLAGADDFYDWLDVAGHPLARDFAARLYVRVVSSPQLFIEGNQRTAALCASYVLAAAGLSPLVLDVAMAVRFAPVAEACRAVDRTRPLSGIRSRVAAFRFERLLQGRDESRYLKQPEPAAPGRG